MESNRASYNVLGPRCQRPLVCYRQRTRDRLLNTKSLLTGTAVILGGVQRRSFVTRTLLRAIPLPVRSQPPALPTTHIGHLRCPPPGTPVDSDNLLKAVDRFSTYTQFTNTRRRS